MVGNDSFNKPRLNSSIWSNKHCTESSEHSSTDFWKIMRGVPDIFCSVMDFVISSFPEKKSPDSW